VCRGALNCSQLLPSALRGFEEKNGYIGKCIHLHSFKLIFSLLKQFYIFMQLIALFRNICTFVINRSSLF
jgi:hypothetical protein